MSTTYTGDPTAAQSPSPAPGLGLAPILTIPVDGEGASVASVLQAFKTLADFVAYLTQSAPGGLAFGDGSAGDVTISGTTELSDAPYESLFYRNLTIGASGFLTTGRRIVRVKDTLTIASGGLLQPSLGLALFGHNSTGTGATTGGVATGTQFAGTGGGAGSPASGPGSNGASTSLKMSGGNGGNGGSAPGYGSSVGSTGTAPTDPRSYFLYVPGFGRAGDELCGGCGGGGGGAGTGSGGGGGGCGGSILAVFARRIVIASASAIRSPGGAGGGGFGTNGGGGGGGGGGFVFTCFGVKTGPALTAAASTPGGTGGIAGGGGAAAGDNGANGQVIEYSLGA